MTARASFFQRACALLHEAGAGFSVLLQVWKADACGGLCRAGGQAHARRQCARRRRALSIAAGAPRGLRLSGAALAKHSADGQRETDKLWSRLVATRARALAPARARFEASAKLLETLSYENILARGFALVRSKAAR
ncbi:MAG: hypothetical protein H6848_13170 [Caulobacterales bacterium]|nr:hypothetical protein [Caulobacterales bacterium]